MQIKGKILTIAGIILIFGYFIMESFERPYDSTQVVMIGNDTLGRDWGALAEQIATEKMLQQAQMNEEMNQTGAAGINGKNAAPPNTLLSPNEDPYNNAKLNQDNYYSIESPDGREIITGYSRPEEQVADDEDRYKSRHQQDLEEPQMIYRE
jgi:hypothetical protein